MKVVGSLTVVIVLALGALVQSPGSALAQPQPYLGPDSVRCEPQPPYHPLDYWYSVTPAIAGRCDFHVQVFDEVESHYTSWIGPPNWMHAVHFDAGSGKWWASWWSPPDSVGGCPYPMSGTFICGFTNTTLSTWGEWTTTIDNSWDPFPVNAQNLADWSGYPPHSQTPDGYGRMVHVPSGIPTPAEERSWGSIKALYR
jgi:hypothetical protein